MLTCITDNASACCILLRTARNIRSRFSPSCEAIFVMSIETRRPTNVAVCSDVFGSSSLEMICTT